MIVIPEFVHKSELGTVVCPALWVLNPEEMLKALSMEGWGAMLDEEEYICYTLKSAGFEDYKLVESAINRKHGAINLEAVVMTAYKILDRIPVEETMIVRHAWCDHMREYLKGEPE